MTAIHLTQEEEYPVYRMGATGDVTVEVDQDTLNRWIQARADYDRVQEEMSEVYMVAEAEQQRAMQIRRAQQDMERAQERLNQLKGES